MRNTYKDAEYIFSKINEFLYINSEIL